MTDLNLLQKTTSLIGGLGMTRVDVYNQWKAPDGKFSGCPHIHAICAEAYYVLEGEGYVEVHTLDDGLGIIPLKPGAYFQFPPNVMHRIVSEIDLSVLGIMNNSGLPENGDARIYFGQDVDEDPNRYAALVKLTSKGLEGALERRDSSVRAYMCFIELWESDRDAYFQELNRFIMLHQKNVLSEQAKFLPYIMDGPLAWGKHAASLLRGQLSTFEGDQFSYHSFSNDTRLGMCGRLSPVKANAVAFSPNLIVT